MKARRGGFTLIEMMITLVIAAILLAIGVPSFRTLIQNQRMTTTVNDFFAAVNLTRSAALERGMQVRLVPADDAGSDWTQGWIVFVDEDDDKRPDSNEPVIFRHGPVPDGMQISSNIGTAPLFIGFSATGSLRMPANQKGGTMTFQLDDMTRLIRFNFLGRARVCDPAKEPTTCTVTTNG
ncbi:MAG: GspH/FimT family pseudopilin [Burkholderiaceae bacterium]